MGKGVGTFADRTGSGPSASAAAVGVMGLPQAPQKRAPSSSSVEQCGQDAISVLGQGRVTRLSDRAD